MLGVSAALLAVGSGAPVHAQRYPPFPIGGDSGTGGTGNNPGTSGNPSSSGADSEFFTPGSGSAGSNGGGSGSGGSSSANSDDDGPACDLAHCLRYAGEVGGRFVAARVEELGDLRVAAVSGCCEAHSRVDVFIESERRFLGTVYASEDGSYLGVFTIPAEIKPGTHHIVAAIEGCGEFRGALEVVARGTSGDGDGTSVLGTTVQNTASGGGILPRTGGDLFRLAMWALILIGLGTLLVLATRRLGERFAPVRAFGRVRRTGRAVAALPPPEVPFVDTSRFVPYGADRRTLARSSGRATRDRSRTASSDWTRAPKNESPG